MKYLIYCGPGIGDFILILPMVRRIKQSDHSGVVTILMTSDSKRIKASKELFELQKEIDSIEYYSLKEKLHFIPLFLRLFIKRYDFGFCLQYTDNANTSKWPGRLLKLFCHTTCGIKHSYHSNIKYDHEIQIREGKHIVDYTMEMLDTINIQEKIICYDNLLDNARLELIFKKTKIRSNRFICLVVGTADVCGKIDNHFIRNDSKNWSHSKWIELGLMLSKLGYDIILLGGTKEKERFSKLYLNNQFINLLGKCSVKDSISIINKSELVIGADTGMMHCAGVLEIPSLTIFGCTDYREYLPIGKKSYFIKSNRKCSPCFGSDLALTCSHKKCMSEITVDDVYSKALTILKSK